MNSSYNERNGKISPDGRWVAYWSDLTGRPEIFVQAVSGGGKWQISDGLAFQPLWSPTGKELFFRGVEGIFAVDVELGDEEIRAGRPELLFSEPLGNPWGVSVTNYIFEDYDVAADGQRFVVFPRRLERGGAALVRLYTGWFQELRRLTESAGP